MSKCKSQTCECNRSEPEPPSFKPMQGRTWKLPDDAKPVQVRRCPSRLGGNRCQHDEGHAGDHGESRCSQWMTKVEDKRLKLATPDGWKWVEECTHEQLVDALYGFAGSKGYL